MDVSQYGEAGFLIKYFSSVVPTHKYLVDIGAFGIVMSNTFNLIMEHGWRGLLIELYPTTKYFEPLKMAMAGRDGVKILNCAVGDGDMAKRYYVHEIAGHGSLVRESERWVPVVMRSLEGVFCENCVPHDFDLLSVDAEGMDYRIMKFMFDRTPYRPRVIVFEKGDFDDESIFKAMGYEILFETLGNKAYVKK